MVAVLLYLDGVGNTSIRDKNVRGGWRGWCMGVTSDCSSSTSCSAKLFLLLMLLLLLLFTLLFLTSLSLTMRYESCDR